MLAISEIPTPYRVPLYERIVAAGEVELEVAFCAHSEPDRPWARHEGLDRVPHRFLRGWSPTLRTGGTTFTYEVNPEIAPLLRRGRYDAIVIGGYGVFTEQFAIAYARVTRTPYVLHNESHHRKPRSAWKRGVKGAVLPTLIGGASAGLAAGTLAAEYLASYGLSPDQVRIFPNTIDVAAYAETARGVRASADAVRSKLGLPERYSLFVGRLVDVKGVQPMLAAQERAGERAPALVVAGEGPLRARVDGASNVIALGFRQPEELIELYALAERTVVPSLSETWGVAVNEALACGSPVIASDAVGAAHDLIQEGEGVVVPAGDVGALTAALLAPMESLEPPARSVAHWDYAFGVSQFHEAIEIALARSQRT